MSHRRPTENQRANIEDTLTRQTTFLARAWPTMIDLERHPDRPNIDQPHSGGKTYGHSDPTANTVTARTATSAWLDQWEDLQRTISTLHAQAVEACRGVEPVRHCLPCNLPIAPSQLKIVRGHAYHEACYRRGIRHVPKPGTTTQVA